MGPGTAIAVAGDSASRAKIANIVEVCNVSKEEAARVLEACHHDAAMAIDRFLSGVEAGWSQVSAKKKKTTTSTLAATINSSSSGGGGGGGGGGVGGDTAVGGGGGGGAGGAGRGGHNYSSSSSGGGGGHGYGDRVDRADRGGDRAERNERGGDRGAGDRAGDRPMAGGSSGGGGSGSGSGSGDRRGDHHNHHPRNDHRSDHRTDLPRGDNRGDHHHHHHHHHRGGDNNNRADRNDHRGTGDHHRADRSSQPAPGAPALAAAPPSSHGYGAQKQQQQQQQQPIAQQSHPAASNGYRPAPTVSSKLMAATSTTTSSSSSHSPAAAHHHHTTQEAWSTATDAPAAQPALAAAPGAPQAPPADSWGATAPPAAEWGEQAPVAFNQGLGAPPSEHKAEPAGVTASSHVPLVAGVAGTASASKGAPAPTALGTVVAGPGVTQVKRTFNYAAAARAGTSHAPPVAPRPTTDVSGQAGDNLADAPSPTPAPAMPVGAGGSSPSRPSDGQQQTSSNSASGGAEGSDAKKRRNRGGRKHRARMEAMRAAQDGSASGTNGTGTTANGGLGGRGEGHAAEDDDDGEPLAGSVAEASLEAPVRPPNAWAARVAAKEKKEADQAAVAASTVASNAPANPVTLGVAMDPPVDKLSLQFGSFSLGTVDWSTSDQASTSKSMASVAPVVVAAPADHSTPPVTGTATSAAASAPAPQAVVGSGGSSNTIVSSSATDIIPGTGLGLGPGAPLMGLGNAPAAMAQLGAAGGGFGPGGYGAPNPYGMMLGYSPAGIPGYDGGSDLKGMPPGIPFYDPTSLQAGLGGAPGKFPAMPDMGLLPSGAPGAGSKLSGMDMDKSGGPGSQGGLPDMYMMGYPPQNVGYPPLYGFAPNPYTGAMPPGSVPPPGSNPYGYNPYPTQNGQLSGGKFASSNQQQGGRGSFGFDDAGGPIGGNGGRNNSGLGESVYMPMQTYLSGHIPDGMTGNVGLGAGGKSLGHDGSYMGGRSNVSNGVPHSGGQLAGPGPHVGVSSQAMSYGNDYSMSNNSGPGGTGPAGGWNDQGRGLAGSGARDGNGNVTGMPQASAGSGMYTPAAPPNGYWPQQGGYY